jgi:hypothetical protein
VEGREHVEFLPTVPEGECECAAGAVRSGRAPFEAETRPPLPRPWLRLSEHRTIQAGPLQRSHDDQQLLHLEGLEQRKEEAPHERFATARSDTTVLNDQLKRGDFFVCASEKQRDFWLGQMTAIGRINPATYDQDASLRRLGVDPSTLAHWEYGRRQPMPENRAKLEAFVERVNSSLPEQSGSWW